MIFECNRKRVLVYLLMSMRFLLFLSVTPLYSLGQSTDTTKISGKIGTEYFDIFRQRSDRLSTTSFARSFDVTILASRGSDTLALGYSGWNQYASYNSFNSNIGTAAENGLRSFSLQWTSSTGWLDYSGTVFLPISHTFLPVRSFGGWIRLKPSSRLWTGTFSYEEMPASFTSGLGLEDFIVQLNDESDISSWNITFQSRPLEYIEGIFALGKTITDISKKNEGYSSQLDWSTENLSTQLNVYLDTRSSFWVGWSKIENKGNAALSEDGLMFGYLTDGNLTFNRWLAGGKTIVFSLPVSIEYSYNRGEGNGVGEIESWPFTPIAATVFSNRLYYEVNGYIIMHRIESNTFIEAGNLHIEPELGFFYILTDISLKHWEPQYLVFFNNVNTEPFSIERCCLLRIGCRFDFPFFGANVAVQLEQFIPLYVKYNEEQHTAGVPSSPTTSGNPSSTDGGRRIRLQVSMP